MVAIKHERTDGHLCQELKRERDNHLHTFLKAFTSVLLSVLPPFLLWLDFPQFMICLCNDVNKADGVGGGWIWRKQSPTPTNGSTHSMTNTEKQNNHKHKPLQNACLRGLDWISSRISKVTSKISLKTCLGFLKNVDNLPQIWSFDSF